MCKLFSLSLGNSRHLIVAWLSYREPYHVVGRPHSTQLMPSVFILPATHKGGIVGLLSWMRQWKNRDHPPHATVTASGQGRVLVPALCPVLLSRHWGLSILEAVMIQQLWTKLNSLCLTILSPPNPVNF